MATVADIVMGPQKALPTSQTTDQKADAAATDAAFSLLLESLLGVLVQSGRQQDPAQTDTLGKTTSQKTENVNSGPQAILPVDGSVEPAEADKADEVVFVPTDGNVGKGGTAQGTVKPSAENSTEDETLMPTEPDEEKSDKETGNDRAEQKTELDELFLKKTAENGTQKKKETDRTAEKGSGTTAEGKNFSSALTNASSFQNSQSTFTEPAAASRPHDVVPTVRPPAPDAADQPDSAVTIVKDGTQLAVKLEPDGLGKLDINLSLDKGSVNAQIQVSDGTTKSLIENNLQQIVDSLLKEGLSVGGFSVSLKNGGQEYGAHDMPGNYGENNEGKNASISAPADIRGGQRGLINLFV